MPQTIPTDWPARVFAFKRYSPFIQSGELPETWEPSAAQIKACRTVLDKLPEDMWPDCCKHVADS